MATGEWPADAIKASADDKIDGLAKLLASEIKRLDAAHLAQERAVELLRLTGNQTVGGARASRSDLIAVAAALAAGLGLYLTTQHAPRPVVVTPTVTVQAR